jgi:hypothetical protein
VLAIASAKGRSGDHVEAGGRAGARDDGLKGWWSTTPSQRCRRRQAACQRRVPTAVMGAPAERQPEGAVGRELTASPRSGLTTASSLPWAQTRIRASADDLERGPRVAATSIASHWHAAA